MLLLGWAYLARLGFPFQSSRILSFHVVQSQPLPTSPFVFPRKGPIMAWPLSSRQKLGKFWGFS